jgi:anti-anti-sigma factor
MVGDERVVTVTGELDLTNCSTFEKALLTAVAATRRGCELVVDLSGVRFFDVSALRALLAAADAAQAVLGADLSRADRGLIRTPDGVRPRISIPPST